ncbi:transglycosylase SLT domain-containing protein [Methylocapsa sp. D3K7]|uniref:lytic transglycosylase domain-containing protein n=1 Tax=Methylocapsa sp. D3K7 TaxID=3041435 RepID=UPI00244EEA0A|nr:transglycosylase SLT domain-containing protein [Methylocapsa sp. D3K7]WGJ14748.1 transglycosylase SLT domain-containing protein [Methylocapsa sp. D3K7]
MQFRKTASGFSCAVFLTQAGTALAEASPPLPIPRPVGADAQAQNEAPPLVPEANLDQALNPKNIDASTRGFYRALIKREAEKNGLPSDIADAVAAIESGYDPGAVGGVGEIGLMQVRPETAAMMGFKGDAAELAKPDVNIHYGVTYLGQAWRLANGDLCRALMKYRAGHGEEMMSELSVNYCGRARAHLAAVGSPFAAGVSVPFVFEPAIPRAPAPQRGPRIRTAAVSRAFWAAQEARVKAITKRVEAKWRRVASR